jgi:hypothetical protein
MPPIRLLKCTLPWNYLELNGPPLRMCGCGPHEEQTQDDPTAIDMYSEADISFSDYEAARCRLCLAVKVRRAIVFASPQRVLGTTAALTTFNAANEAAPTWTGSGVRQVFEPAPPYRTL